MSVRTATHVVSSERPNPLPSPSLEVHTAGFGMTPQTAAAVIHNLTNRVEQLEAAVMRLSVRVRYLEKEES